MENQADLNQFPLKILYEDNHMIAVLKPAGLLAMGDKTGDPTVLDHVRYYLKMKYFKPGKVYLGVVHRLDRPVGGVLLLAKTSKAAARLTAAFKEHEIRKLYWAVCSPPPDPAQGSLDDFLIKEEAKNTSRVVDSLEPGARDAGLDYRTIRATKRAALIEIGLRTGRPHQIRVQFSHHGWPIMGDHRYGRGEDRPLALFARRLEFMHPVRKEPMVIEADPPEGLLDL